MMSKCDKDLVAGESTPLLAANPANDDFDHVLAQVGTFGPWQAVTVALLWLPAVGGGVIVLLWSFVGLEPSYVPSIYLYCI